MLRPNSHLIAGLFWAAILTLGVAVSPAPAQTSGQVNISGATLFRPFFDAPASTNDHIDVDGDGKAGWNPAGPWYVDQLATSENWSNPVGWTTHWVVQYRGVGSGNGLKELDKGWDGAFGTATPYLEAPAEVGTINRDVFWTGTALGPVGDGSNPNWGYTPVNPNQIDIGVMDVPTKWFVQNTAGSAAYSRLPTQPGYGTNPTTAWDGSQSNKLKTLSTLNTDTASPTSTTVYDTQIAWVPIGYIANAGTDLENVKTSQLQHLWVTGRMPNGENLVGATRDSGSGTRNGGMNTIGLDPSHARGDNLGSKLKEKGGTNLGYTYDATNNVWMPHQATNLGGSSIMEEAVKNRRLAVGYDGLAGGSRAVVDATNGMYEILNVWKDTGAVTGTRYLRPSLNALLDNANPSYGWQFGGPETMATVGDPMATYINAAYPALTSNPKMSATSAAAYVRNIVESISLFSGSIGSPTVEYNMPGEFMATQFTLLAGIDAIPSGTNPTLFYTNPSLNQNVQDYARANHAWATNPVPAHGSHTANLVPKRGSLNPGGGAPPAPISAYSDGSVNGDYIYYSTVTSGTKTVIANAYLNDRNQVACDFNNDRDRDITDIEKMMEAVRDPRGFAQTEVTAGGYVQGYTGSLDTDCVIPEIIGDCNGDGSLDHKDVRYFCDGLAVSPTTGKLDRREAFKRADQKWQALAGTMYFNGGPSAGGTTVLATGKAYSAGDAAFDVAGNTTAPGADPRGYDGRVDEKDLAYIRDNYGDFTDLSQAQDMDLSCDMDGDLDVDTDDFEDCLNDCLGTWYGDANFDRTVDVLDLARLANNFGMGNADWTDTDFNGDGTVDVLDLAVIANNFGWSSGGDASPVPEPGTALVLVLGAVGVACRRRRRRA